MRRDGGRLAVEEMRDLGLDNSYIYIYIRGIFVISRKPGFIRVGFQVGFRIFLIKPKPNPDLLQIKKKKTHTRPYS